MLAAVFGTVSGSLLAGQGTEQFIAPGGCVPPHLFGEAVYFAFCTHDPFDFVSNVVVITNLP